MEKRLARLAGRFCLRLGGLEEGAEFTETPPTMRASTTTLLERYRWRGQRANYSVGVGAVVEEALETEEMLLEEVVGEVGGGDADAEDQQTVEDDVHAFVGCDVGPNKAAQRGIEISEEDQVEDVDAVAVLAEPTHGMKSAKACDEMRA
jgi:hypothetical protein